MKKYILIIMCCFFAASVTAQRKKYRRIGDYNRLGLQAQYILYDISTDDIAISGEGGFLGGLATRGKIYNNWGAIIAVEFFTTNLDVASSAQQNLAYNLIGAQVSFWPSYNILGQHLSIEAGPSLQINSRLRLTDSNQEDTIIAGFSNVSAQDIQEISRVLPLVGVGISGGFKRVRFTVQYRYGFTNIFNRLSEQNIESIDALSSPINGNISMLSGGITVYL